MTTVDAEADPAGEVTKVDGGDLLRGHDGGVEDVQCVVGAIRQPEFFFIGSQGDAVAGAAVALQRTGLVIGDFDAAKKLAGVEVADFEARQIVYVDKTRVPRPFTVNGRIGLEKGPTVSTTVWVLVSATERYVERRPAMYTREPSRE